MNLEDIDLQVHGKKFGARRWSSQSKDPSVLPIKIIALHGWLDNAASFDFLSPLFDYPNLELIALDLAGHGRSDHRQDLSAYNIWSDVLELNWVLDHLQWSRVFLLGHSRGAMITTLFSGTFPERVAGTALIEAFGPQTLDESLLPQQLAQAAINLPKLGSKKARRYSSFDKAVTARQKGFFELPEAAAKALAKRSVVKSEDGYYWASDQKLLAPSEVKFSDAQVKAFIDNMPQKALLVIGRQGLVITDTINFEKIKSQENCECVEFNGDHHLHMTSSHTNLKKIAHTIQGYYVDQLKNV